MKPKRILILGYPYFVNRLMELGGNSQYELLTLPKNWFNRLLILTRVALLYQVGGNLRPNRFHRLAFLLGKKLIIHWVGSDIIEMKKLHQQGYRFSPTLRKKAIHWVEANWTAQELHELGITGKVVPLTPAAFPEEVNELPDKFVVLTYLPPNKSEFYGEAEIIDLAKEFPEIVFLAVAASPIYRNPEWPSNLISVGWVDKMAELYHEISLLIRLPQHDGLSFMVLEALAHGRHVIWNHPFTGVRETKNRQTTIQLLKEFYHLHTEGKLKINRTGRNFVKQYYNPQVVWGRISKGIDGVLSR